MEEIIYPTDIKNNFLQIFQDNIEKIEKTFNLNVSLRGNKIMFEGETRYKKDFKKYIGHIVQLSLESRLDDNDLNMSLSMIYEGNIGLIKEELSKKIKIRINGKEVYPRTYNQKRYMKAIAKNDLAFGIGPAGTGKTFLAIAMGLNYLLNKQVQRIVVTRPVVEAGEKLGFLPGDIQQKVNPYFRPIYDALYSLIGFDKTAELIEKEIVEIAPLAYMRGRTIDNAFLLLDEGQNTSNSQMKMFLTRFGQNSKVVVTADTTQIDLPDPKKSGIFKAIKLLRKIAGIQVINLTGKDVVRHALVQNIIEAYERKKDEV
ncbi:MAG: PhoH family protein [Candidatus Aminicenantes bacterium]|nr:PhoH family protein [Candidatus Aminicenantes bacterium]